MSDCFVWDASPLVHAARIDRLDVLADLAAGPVHAPWQHVTTAAVAEEVVKQEGIHPAWLDVVHVDGIGELTALTRWVERVSSSTHSQGEATVFAWAEQHEATAVVDDKDARRVARTYGLSVHGVLWIAGQAVNQGRWPVGAVSAFLDQMAASGARYPFGPSGFESWARAERLIE